MKVSHKWLAVLAAVALMAGARFAVACGYGSVGREASSEHPEIARAAIELLRQEGERGLQSLLRSHRRLINAQAEGTIPANDPQWQRFLAAVDAVGGQRNCYASKLYWHTDIDTAKAVAKQRGKPILSLRLLGNLTDELSCANSRFFRSTLYANAEVSQFLRDNFVLHWQSVRPVPKVTIDFGDGRKLERTLTGNSIHYVLDSDGNVLDALPGLYGPQAFVRGLNDAVMLHATVAPPPMFCGIAEPNEAERNAALVKYHQKKQQEITERWQADLRKLGLLPPASPKELAFATATASASRPQLGSELLQQAERAAPPRREAVAAGNIAVPKMFVERPLLAATLIDANLLAEKTDDAVWGRIAELHRGDAELDAASVAVIREQNPQAAVAGALAWGKRQVEDPILRLVRSLQTTIAIDTVRNEYTLHRQIHDWLATGNVPLDTPVDQLNERVYAELFLTPSSDPWLGLMPADVYTALENGGVVQN